MQEKCVSLGDKGVKIQRHNTICSFQQLHHHHLGSRRPGQRRCSTHRFPPTPNAPGVLLHIAALQGENKKHRLTTASSSLHRVTDGTLRPLVVLFGRLRSRRLLLLKAAPEEGQHRGHQVVSTLGGGDVVSFIWENLGGEKEKS